MKDTLHSHVSAFLCCSAEISLRESGASFLSILESLCLKLSIFPKEQQPSVDHSGDLFRSIAPVTSVPLLINHHFPRDGSVPGFIGEPLDNDGGMSDEG